MLTVKNTVLLVVDVQGKLAQLMHGKEQLFKNLRKIIRGAGVLELPVIWMEQNPEGLGPTVPEVAEVLSGLTPISKINFSCCKNPAFMQRLKDTSRNQVLLTGIEAHICIYQTALDLLDQRFQVEVVADAVSSRLEENKNLALAKVQKAGAGLTSVEMALFELLKAAEGDKFKEILKIIK